MDARFTSNIFERFCAENFLSFIAAPAKKHTGIGSLERKHAVVARILHEVLTEMKTEKRKSASLDIVASMVTMIANSQISSADGNSAGPGYMGEVLDYPSVL